MARRPIPPLVLSILSSIAIIAISAGIIAYGRGYRFNFQEKSVGSTGLITATSDPLGAQVFINGKKYTATNSNINIAPGWYTVTIMKEGYQPWEKKIRVVGEVVARADAMLFPANPSLYAITTNGITNPTVSPDGTKIAYTVPVPEKQTNGVPLTSRTGLWILDVVDKTLGVNRDARLIIKPEVLDTTNATITWSPDGKQLLIDPTPEISSAHVLYLADTDKLNETLAPVYDRTLIETEWADLASAKAKEKLLPLKESLTAVATSSMNIIAFSPDETKILYEATASATIPHIITPALIGVNSTEEVRTITPGNLYVYDIKEDRNYMLGKTSIIARFPLTSSPAPIQWLPTSAHLIIIGNNAIDVMEYDGQNRKTLYAGPFVDGFVVPWTNASKVLILTNLNPGASALSNIYAVNIR